MAETNNTEVSEEAPKEASENQENGNTPQEKPEESLPALTDDAKLKIKTQLEYYFGDFNLPRDKFLRQQTEIDDGWVPLNVLLKFSRLAQHARNENDIITAMEDLNSELLELSEDKKKLKRNKPLPDTGEESQEKTIARTVYCKGFEQNEALDDLLEYFKKFGPINAVQMRTYNQKNPKQKVFKGSVFVVFEQREVAEDFMKLDSVKYKETELIRKWQKDYIEEKKAERENKNKKDKEVEKDNDEEEESDELKLPTNCYLLLKEIPENVAVTDIKAVLTEKCAGVTISYVTFNKGDTQAYVRLSEQDAAAKVMEQLGENPVIVLNEKEVQVIKVSEEDEKPLIEEAMISIKKAVHNKKFSHHRGRKRKGGFRGGYKGKRQRNN